MSSPHTRKTPTAAAAGVCLWLTACGPGAPKQPPPLLRLSSESGLTFVHRFGAEGARELPETMGAGAALFDADQDGDIDVYCVQSGPLRKPDQPRAGGGENELFLNDGRGHFSPSAGALGADDGGYGQGVAVGDADGDGREDLFVLNWGPNALYLNRGAAFELAEGALPAADQWSVAGTFVDVDGDGDLDFYEVNYLVTPPESHLDPRINVEAPAGYRLYPHPDLFRAEPDRLLINDGQGRFEHANQRFGLDHDPQKGLGVVSFDLDLDGWPDLYVSDDSTPNLLLWNQAGQRFEEQGRPSGAALNDDGQTEAGMGVDSADVDGDLDLDLFCTNLDQESNTLYLNETRPGSPPRFKDRTRAAGLAEQSRPWVGFGTLFADLDADGAPDLLVANGHIIDNVAELSDVRRHAQPNQVFLGTGRGQFSALTLSGPAAAFAEPRVSRGLYCADLDGDGALDFLETVHGSSPRVFLGGRQAGLWISAQAGRGNPQGLGARIFLDLEGGQRLLGSIESGRSYAGACQAVWAVSPPAPVTAIEVLWPGGLREAFAAPEVGARHLALVKGQGRPVGP